MKVTTAKIQALSPCRSRLDAFLVENANFSGNMTKFLNLKNVLHKDKCWVYFRMLPKERIRLVAADIAESVLSIYEKRCPSDYRPREAIEAARSGDVERCKKAQSAAAYAAFAAAYAADADAYAAAAYAADAAAYAADAAYAYAYAADAAYAYAAAYAAADAADAADAAYAYAAAYAADADADKTAARAAAKSVQEEIQIKIMKRHLRGL